MTVTSDRAGEAALREHRLGLLRGMLLIRRFEEKAGQLYGMGHIGGFCWLARETALRALDLVVLVGGDGLFDAGRSRVVARPGGPAVACCRDLFVYNFASRPGEG